MAFNDFRQESKPQAVDIAAALKAKLAEASPNLASYVQGSRIVVPLTDVKNATVSVSLAPDSRKVVSLTVTF